MLFGYILVIALIKTSLLGLGIISISVAMLAILILKFAPLGIPEVSKKQFKRVYKIALFGHLSAYIGLIVKAFFIDGIEDIPTFIVSHLVLHHLLCAAIAGIATFMSLRIFLANRHQGSVKSCAN